MKLLLVEDNEADQQLCQSAVADFNEDNSTFRVDLEVCGNVTEAEKRLNESDFDGVIIDMKLTSSEPDEGNQVIQQIKESLNRIPVVIMTGTPDVAEQNEFPLIDICKKGDIQYREIIDQFQSIYRTGLTRILGGKGLIEQKLTTIFIKNLLPALTNSPSGKRSWIKYAESDDTRTEKALLRYTLNHLLQHLDNDINLCYPEEMYISPPINNRINTGSILKQKSHERYFIVMNPACDLAERDTGRCNTDRALLVEIQSLKEIYPDFTWDTLSNKNKKELEKTYKNNKSLYYHWLPKTEFYSGGVINFRRVSTHTEEEINTSFDTPAIQISAPFLKDIISRFSSYYARQGQPDIDIETIGI
ncbi:response regulator [Neisseria chenwenguii]|uniref:Response regulator n=2 Tax=Neisseria chenwenguii TaxID=1853278 RepID=A0A220S117_9NEIS|nr:response regulator [Neisseria chenwenguii]